MAGRGLDDYADRDVQTIPGGTPGGSRSQGSKPGPGHEDRPMSFLSLFDSDEAETPFWTVSELTARVKSALERGFADVALQGEISNLSRPRSGHVYLCLKDEAAQVRAVIWKGDA